MVKHPRILPEPLDINAVFSTSVRCTRPNFGSSTSKLSSGSLHGGHFHKLIENELLGMVIIDNDNHWERGREGHSGRAPVAGILLFLADIVVVPPERLVRWLGALGF